MEKKSFFYTTHSTVREMKVPDSLQTFVFEVFYDCSKLVPSDINIKDNNAVVAYLRSIQNPTPNMSMFWSIAVVLIALIAQFAFMNQ